ncbi:xylulokinase [Peribacillus huizhouensis]|uniref:Xylulose kinase n=1 Tax=Peribacillus huizhouensis TaxID=1501239 RepID=A0ABR6CUG0_9BACI|nr:xylulokinase [Peribacillus huizhouensis]MBA9028556.1 xylulokinase [Peribacillus huizhouensis]
MSYLMGIDLGTSSVKTVIIDIDGNMKSSAQAFYDINIPNKGYAEQDPKRWWKSTVQSIKEALNNAHIQSQELKGIGFSGQMHGMVLIDKQLQVIRPAIIWSDQRTQREVHSIYELLGKNYVGEITLNPLSTGFQTPSLLWVKQNEPETYERIYKVLLPKDYIRLMLTGEIGTDVTDASATLAFDTRNLVWSDKLISTIGLNRDFYPNVNNPFDIAGEITEKASKETGLYRGTPVVYGGGDQPMQSVGNGIVEAGQVSLTIGTGGQVFSVISEPKYDKQMRTHTFCNAVPGTWNIMGASLAAGLSLSWLNEKILSNMPYHEINELAKSVKPGSEGLLFLPYLTGERTPHMDSSARGTFIGLVLNHSRANLIRAVMEGVVFALKDSVEIIKSLDTKMDTFIASGGGARSDVWLQIQANILNQEIYKVSQEEQACVGAAIMAGVGVQAYPSIKEACQAIIQISDEPVVPHPEDARKYNDMYQYYKMAYQQNKELFHHLSDFS